MSRRGYPGRRGSPKGRSDLALDQRTRRAPSLRGCAPFVVASAPLALCRLVELREGAAEEVARALLRLPDALAREAPLLAQVLQRARIVLRQAVTQDVPGQLAHPLANAAHGIAHVLVLLGTPA